MIQPHLEPQFVNSVSPGSELRPELTAQNVTRAYESLEHLPCDLGNLEPFLDAWSDVSRWVRQGESHVYWKRHQNLNDDLALEAFTNFYGPITEAARHGEVRLRARFLALDPASLPEAYRHIHRSLEAEERSSVQPGSGLFEQQSELVAKLVNDLHAIRVDFDGEPLSISSLNRLSYNDPDRTMRERAWRAVDAAMLEHFDGFANDFIAVLELRSQIAQESGNASFVEHHWWSRNRSDYAPSDCVVLADAVAEHFGPLLERFHERKCDRLGLESVRPWDVRFEPDAGPVGLEAEDSSAGLSANGPSVDGSSASMGAGLKVEDCLEAISEVLNGLHPKLAGVYDRIRGVATPAPAMTAVTVMNGIAQRTVLPAVEPVSGGIKLEGLERFDLEARPDKSNANFADYWPEARHPVVMMNFEGSADDFGMLVHEFGHALHFTLAGERQRHYWSLTNSLEFMEFTSQFLELLVLERLGVQGLIFDAEGFALARQNQARVILTQLMHVCRSDRFQQWIYNLSPEGLEAGQVNSQQINAAYVGLVQPFRGGVNWDGLEGSRSRAWLDEGLFAFPLYDIEYVFAWVASLLLLEAVLPLAEFSGDDSGQASSQDSFNSIPQSAEVNLEVLDRWVAALEAGNTLSTGELFRAVGLSFPFAAADVARAARVYERLFSAFL